MPPPPGNLDIVNDIIDENFAYETNVSTKNDILAEIRNFGKNKKRN